MVKVNEIVNASLYNGFLKYPKLFISVFLLNYKSLHLQMLMLFFRAGLMSKQIRVLA